MVLPRYFCTPETWRCVFDFGCSAGIAVLRVLSLNVFSVPTIGCLAGRA